MWAVGGVQAEISLIHFTSWVLSCICELHV
jgi:hypothetical protein